MKNTILLLLIAIGLPYFSYAQTHSKIPSRPLPNITLNNLNGPPTNVADYAKDGKITIFKFWGTWALGCIQDLEETAKLCRNWEGELDVDIVSVSLDSPGSTHLIKPYINRYGWDFDILLDTTDVLLSAMGTYTSVLPYTVIADHNGKIIAAFQGNVDGTREVLKELVKQARSSLPVVTTQELKRRAFEQRAILDAQRRGVAYSVDDIPEYRTPQAIPNIPTTLVGFNMPVVPVKNASATPPIATPPPPPPVNLETVKLVYNDRDEPIGLDDRKVKKADEMLVYGDKVLIDIWDTEYEDGDIVSVYYDGEWILRDYKIKNKPTRLTIPLNTKGDNRFILYAHNEGTRPPNTVALTIIDEHGERTVNLVSDLSTCASINLRVKPSK